MLWYPGQGVDGAFIGDEFVHVSKLNDIDQIPSQIDAFPDGSTWKTYNHNTLRNTTFTFTKGRLTTIYTEDSLRFKNEEIIGMAVQTLLSLIGVEGPDDLSHVDLVTRGRCCVQSFDQFELQVWTTMSIIFAADIG